jgi:serine/threonine protein kinase
MGNSSLRPSLVADAAVNFQADLPKFILQSKIGNGKLMKTYLMRCESNSVVVKVYMSYPDEEIRIFAAELTRIWYTISPSKYPNLLPYQLWMKSTSRQPKSTVVPIYLIRQYLYSNLHDRISTRPFLNETEKYWILYQIFKCLETCHDLMIMHGDIKPENILCTTNNWVVLTDFAAFKPVNVPDDNPSDFQYFFDSMGRPRCYIAPERFCNKVTLVKRRSITTGASTDAVISSSSAASSSVTPSKRPAGLQSTSQSSFERISDNTLLTDSVFGDAAAAAIRSLGTSDAEKHSTKKNNNSEFDKGKEKESDERERDDTSSSRKLYSSLTVGMDVFSLGCTMAEVIRPLQLSYPHLYPLQNAFLSLIISPCCRGKGYPGRRTFPGPPRDAEVR